MERDAIADRDVQVSGRLLVDEGAVRGTDELPDLGGEPDAILRAKPHDLPRPGCLHGAAGVSLEPGRISVPYAFGHRIHSRSAECGHGGVRIGAGDELDLPIDGDRGDRTRSHNGHAGRDEGAD